MDEDLDVPGLGSAHYPAVEVTEQQVLHPDLVEPEPGRLDPEGLAARLTHGGVPPDQVPLAFHGQDPRRLYQSALELRVGRLAHRGSSRWRQARSTKSTPTSRFQPSMSRAVTRPGVSPGNGRPFTEATGRMARLLAVRKASSATNRS